jgi:hypothetical protein
MSRDFGFACQPSGSSLALAFGDVTVRYGGAAA